MAWQGIVIAAQFVCWVSRREWLGGGGEGERGKVREERESGQGGGGLRASRPYVPCVVLPFA